MLPNDGLFGHTLPVFEGDFITPWEYHRPLLVTDDPVAHHSPDDQAVSPSHAQYPANSNPNPVRSCFGSDETNKQEEATIMDDDRKRRRMISNRESARRSRMRKQKHLENLRSQVNRLRMGNRELMNTLSLVTHHCHVVGRDNERLLSESNILRQRLWDIRQVLCVRELHQQQMIYSTSTTSSWPCNNVMTSVKAEQTPQSLLT